MNGNLMSAAAKEISTQRFPGAPSLALTFLFAGLGFSLPILLFPEAHPSNGPVSAEILNLNFLVAWMGLAHFVFAFRGQGRYLMQTQRRGSLMFVLSLLASAVLLIILKGLVGGPLFAFIIWIYFIPHFVRAELHFEKSTQAHAERGWVLYWFPALAFAFLTYALFGPKELTFNTAILIALGFLVLVAGVLGGIREQLYSENAKYTLLGCFFIGEALVWGTYSKYMTPQFRQGVYVFHIAVASFYHYFRSYGFALQKKIIPASFKRYMATIVGVNVAILCIGRWVIFQGPPVLHIVFDVTFFTFWVGLHLVSSDLFAVLRKFNTPQRL